MRILVLDTGRGIGPHKVALWRAQLGLEEHDEVRLLSWHPPAAPLPLETHLVCGPVLRLGREPQRWPVCDSDDVPGDAGPVAPHELSVTGAFELEEQLSEQEAEPGQAAAADRDGRHRDDTADATRTEAGPPEPQDLAVVATPEAPGTDRQPLDIAAGPTPSGPPRSLAHLPVYHPRRVRQAVRWRSRRLRRRTVRLASRQLRRARGRRNELRYLPSTAVSSALRLRSDGIAGEFALATVRSAAVADLVRTSDVVVPVDQRSLKTAWLLARRHRGPAVIATTAAAARAIALRRARS